MIMSVLIRFNNVTIYVHHLPLTSKFRTYSNKTKFRRLCINDKQNTIIWRCYYLLQLQILKFIINITKYSNKNKHETFGVRLGYCFTLSLGLSLCLLQHHRILPNHYLSTFYLLLKFTKIIHSNFT